MMMNVVNKLLHEFIKIQSLFVDIWLHFYNCLCLQWNNFCSPQDVSTVCQHYVAKLNVITFHRSDTWWAVILKLPKLQ